MSSFTRGALLFKFQIQIGAPGLRKSGTKGISLQAWIRITEEWNNQITLKFPECAYFLIAWLRVVNGHTFLPSFGQSGDPNNCKFGISSFGKVFPRFEGRQNGSGVASWWLQLKRKKAFSRFCKRQTWYLLPVGRIRVDVEQWTGTSVLPSLKKSTWQFFYGLLTRLDYIKKVREWRRSPGFQSKLKV